MEQVGIGAGLGALGFWLFIGIVVFATFWDAARKREAQHETLRRIIDSGSTLDTATVDRLLAVGEGTNPNTREEMKASLKVSAVILLFLVPGMLVLGWFVGAAGPLAGVAGLMLFLGIGLWVAASNLDRFYSDSAGALRQQ
jgi:hypothetical protein